MKSPQGAYHVALGFYPKLKEQRMVDYHAETRKGAVGYQARSKKNLYATKKNE